MNNKEVLLKMIEIFERETDEDHTLSIGELKKLLDKGYEETVTKYSIRQNLKVLKNQYNFFHIESLDKDKFNAKLYCKSYRILDKYQLRILIDAIYSAKFIPFKDSKILVEKIKTLTSEHIAKKLESRVFVEDKIISATSQTKNHINTLHEAIEENKMVTFKYQRYNMQKELEFGNNGNLHVVMPYGMVWQNGFYYFVAQKKSNLEFINFRVDRMVEVKKTKEVFIPESFDLSKHIDTCFNMYPGKVETIKIKFHSHLINAIIDRFGVKADITISGDEHFILRTPATMNKGLVRWILNWGSDAEVLYPQELVEEIKEEIGKIHKIYHAKGLSKN